MSKTPKILGPNGNPLPPAMRSQARATAASAMMRRAHQGAGHDHSVTREWHAPTVSGQAAVSQDREKVSSRVHDLARNDAWVAASINKKLYNLVGTGFRPNVMPNWRTLGITREQAENIGEQIEALWRDYSLESGFWLDAERSGNFASIVSSIGYHMIIDNEAFGVLVWRDGSPTGFQTAMQVVHPARCSNPKGIMDSAELKDGVALDALSAAKGYWFRETHPGDRFIAGQNKYKWDYKPRETEFGRPRTVHIRNRREAGMTRAISDFASYLRKGMQLHKYDDYELDAAAFNSLLAAWIKTPLDAGEFADAMDSTDPAAALSNQMQTIMSAQSAIYENKPLDIKGGQLNFLNPGEDVLLTKPEHPNAGFEAFYKFGLRNLAAVTGLTAEQVTMDWSEVNYSSARAAMQEVWKGFMAARGDLIAGFIQPWYRAWLEEVFDKGLLDLPDNSPAFETAVEAWCHADWIGPSRGYIDPLKEQQAADGRIESGISNLKIEGAEQGRDWKEALDQRLSEEAHEAARRKELGLPPRVAKGPPVPVVADDDEEKSGAQQKRERQARSRSGVPLIGRAA